MVWRSLLFSDEARRSLDGMQGSLFRAVHVVLRISLFRGETKARSSVCGMVVAFIPWRD